MPKKTQLSRSALSRFLERLSDTGVRIYDVPLSDQTLARSAADVFANPPEPPSGAKKAASTDKTNKVKLD